MSSTFGAFFNLQVPNAIEPFWVNQRKSASVISKNVVMNALPSSVLCSFRSTHVVPAGS